MYPVERFLHTLKGFVRNKARPEGSIAEGYISEECLTFCSRLFEHISTKLNHVERHENAAGSEPPSGLCIFGSIDYSRKGSSIEILSDIDMHTMRFYILTNYDEVTPWVK